ncbi:pseudouridine synthase [Thelephora ganbajun]|uniref:Pseudouridine synthase n=1 Tax=Thelephora ganbajun TaxID=370292 RepID=A0ACB6ZJ46_THEGA|nr:pseudouridine synthase [Thelephora ganbajun]
MVDTSKYANWTREDLITRVLDLESSLLPGDGTGSRMTTTTIQYPPPISATSSVPLRQSARSKAKAKKRDLSERKPFDFSLHPRRKIALRFTYAGWEYGGLAYQAGLTPLPTVEGVLFDALVQTRLIDGTKGFEGCEWERCGRTDRGVSGAGNVISLWVRSAISQGTPTREGDLGGRSSSSDPQDVQSSEAIPTPNVTRKELRYISILNRVLPPTIRVMAWSPVAPTFSSRFACKYRHYKYFFHSRNLDISRMQDAASRLLGEYDFRNLCKLDASKQVTNFRRTILQASISPARLEGKEGLDGVWMFDLKGTAFLYNQVRHIIAILFLIGAGLEHPSLMTALLNVDKESPHPAFKEGEPIPPIVDRKPEYQMADGLPLVLWDCAYSDVDVHWQIDEGDGVDGGASGAGGVYGQQRSIYERSTIYSALDAYFLESASKHHPAPTNAFPLPINSSGSDGVIPDGSGILQIPLGGGAHQRTSRYVPILSRKRLEDVFVVNERWKAGKGVRKEPPS